MIRNLLRLTKLMLQPDMAGAMGEVLAAYRVRSLVTQHHPKFVVEPGVILLGYTPERLRVSQGRVAAGTILSFGDQVTGFGEITIGTDTWIGQYNNIRTSDSAPISIGSQCLISQFCTLIGANHNVERGKAIMNQPQSNDRLGIQIGDDVWLGAGVVVLPGVRIGNGAVIGAGSIVTRNIPDFEIWMGNPARKHRDRA